METTVEQTLEITTTLRLSKRASEMLTQRAAASGTDVSSVASELIENIIAKDPTVDEALAPFRKQVAESGMSDEALDDFLRGEIEAYRREKKAKSV